MVVLPVADRIAREIVQAASAPLPWFAPRDLWRVADLVAAHNTRDQAPRLLAEVERNVLSAILAWIAVAVRDSAAVPPERARTVRVLERGIALAQAEAD